MSDEALSPILYCPNKPVEQEEEPDYTITFNCDHRDFIPFENHIELVPTIGLIGPYKDKIDVKYEGPNPPENLTVEEDILIEGGNGEFSTEFQIDPGEWFREKESHSNPEEILGLSVLDLFRRMWTYNSKKEYTLIGMPVRIPVTIYNPEQWKIKLSIPPARQCKVGAKYGTHKDAGSSNHLIQFSAHDHSSGTSTSASAKMAKNHSGTSISTNSSESQRHFSGFTVERNGALLQYDGANVILSLMSVIRMAQELIKTIQDKAPKIGWYCEFDISVLDADVEIGWGWKEYSDERAFYVVKAQAEFNLLKIKLEFGFGVEAISYGAQIFATGGGSIPLKLECDRKSPDQTLQAKFGVSGKVIFAVGARVQVAYIVHCEATLESGISLNGDFTFKFNDGIGLGLEAALNFSGIKGKVNWHYGAGGGYGGMSGSEKEELFIEPRPLYDWKWPEEYMAATNLVDAVGFRELLFEEVFQHFAYSFDLKNYFEFGKTSFSKDVGKKIADEFKDRFYNENILRDRKSIEGLCSLIYIRLEEIMRLQGTLEIGLTLENYEYFIDQEMPKIMEYMIDPLSDYKYKHTAGY